MIHDVFLIVNSSCRINFNRIRQPFFLSNTRSNYNSSYDKGDYLKLCGQRFWELISGDEQLYTEIIEPLGHQAHERNENFYIEYAKVINKFTLEFSTEYCDETGAIDWRKLLKYNSGKIE